MTLHGVTIPRLIMLLVALAATALVFAARPARAAEQQVTIQSFAYGPASLTISVGDSVTFKNNDSVAHTATSIAGVTPAFDQNIAAGATSPAVTFAQAGTFAYRCTVHPAMPQATIIVQAPAAPSTGSGLAPAESESAWPFALLALGAVLVLGGGSLAFATVRRRS